MKVRHRHLFAIGLTIATTAIGVYFASSRPMIASFNRLENQRARQDVMRVRQSFVQEVDQLHAKTIDWSNWDDSYRFMKDRNQGFLRSNLIPQTFLDLKIDMVMFLDPSGKEFYSRAEPRLKDLPLLSPEDVRDQMNEGGFLTSLSPTGHGKGGVLLFRGIPVAVSARPILGTAGSGPSRGWLVFVRYLDKSVVGDLRRVTDQDVSLLIPGQTTTITGEAEKALSLPANQGETISAVDDDHLVGLSEVRDIHGKPAIILQTNLPRTVSAQGAAMVRTVTWQLLAIGTVFSVIIILILERFALNRLSVLTKQVGGITDFAGGQRVKLRGRDELSFLAQRINEMLSTLEVGARDLLDSEDRLRVHNENLERTILERTQVIEHQAFHDQLTSLPNRALFNNRLVFALEKSRRNQVGTAVLFVDLDNFKLVNDSLGHDVGDELLVALAGRLVEAVRPGDTVARLGGDEFTILLEDLDDMAEAVKVAERIFESLRKPILLGNRETFACASLGLAYSNDSASSGTELLKNADTAMYRAKAAGKSGYIIYEESMNESAIDRLEMETDLRQALDRDEISVHFQPLVDIATHELRGAEALARWKHPVRGDVPPGEFIPIAEHTGLVLSIGYWILEMACAQAKVWRTENGDSDFVISVNVSGKQLRQADVVDRVKGILARTGLPASGLKLEITESVLMEDRDEIIARMCQLKELGVHLALDDFGTGYSSLSTLLAFPIDTLKIDRTFISGIGQEAGAMAIIEAIIAIARTMHMEVTGEGVETTAQEEVLLNLGCQTGQGYLYDKPLPAEVFGQRFQAAKHSRAA